MVDPAVLPVIGVAFLWVLVGVACRPVLRSEPVRVVVDRWPTDEPRRNYAALVGLVLLGHVATFVAVVAASGGLEGVPIVRGLGGILVGYPLAVWLLLAVGGPATDRWDPSGPGLDGRLVLGLAAAWYALVVAVGLVVFYALAFQFFPS